jgi:peptidyl-tRNA hydrolase, PTH1 family
MSLVTRRLNKNMKLIVGLGNPGNKYEYTRHNIGFMIVDKFVKDKLPLMPSLKAWKQDAKMAAHICKLDDCIVVKPQTYMNNTGNAVLSIVNFYKIDINDVWVIHDDIDLPTGKIRIRTGGGSAGHNGIESIINILHNPEFVRFRLGIGKGKTDIQRTGDHNLHRREIEKYVLSPFKVNEGGEVKKLIKYCVEALELALDKGIETAMNRFN